MPQHQLNRPDTYKTSLRQNRKKLKTRSYIPVCTPTSIFSTTQDEPSEISRYEHPDEQKSDKVKGPSTIGVPQKASFRTPDMLPKIQI